MATLFAAPSGAQGTPSPPQAEIRSVNIPDYARSPHTMPDHILAFMTGFAGMFLVLFVFYRLVLLSVAGGVLCGGVYIWIAAQGAVKKRRFRLRGQFLDALEALSVAMRAGSNELRALHSAREDLLLLYPANSDIIRELDILMIKFENSVPLSEGFADFARRSGLEDVDSFASIYKTIEGKNSRADEIVRQTQRIIADKMEIEMEIDTMMTAAKSEVNIMLFMPLVILGVIGYMGAGFMDTIYTTPMGRVTATFGVIVFIISTVLARKFSSVSV